MPKRVVPLRRDGQSSGAPVRFILEQMPSRLFHAIADEAVLAAEQLALGATAIGRANYAQRGYYYQAFFSLSAGFERTAKLGLILDHAVRNGGQYPPSKAVSGYGHKLLDLLARLDSISAERGYEYRLPRTTIHDEAVRILHGFASNLTRYHNIDYLTPDRVARSEDNPVGDWYQNVVIPSFEGFVSQRRKTQIHDNARMVAFMMEGIASIRHTSETGQELNDAYSASAQTGMTQSAAKYVRLHVLQLCRFATQTVVELSYDAMKAGVPDVPHVSEMYAIFCNSDDYFKGRASWSIYTR